VITNVRVWIRRKPEPHAIAVTTDDGVKTVKLGGGRRKWKDAETTVLALQPSHLEALDKEGTVLRVCDLELPEVEGGDEDIKPTSRFESNLVLVARLLKDAQKNGADAQAEAYRVAFDKQAALVELAYRRLEGLERAWTRALNLQAKVGGEEKENPLELMATAFMARMGGGMMPGMVPPNGQPTAQAAPAAPQGDDEDDDEGEEP